jgi:cytochrome o ubiquinol oxidase subunit 3
VNTTSHDSSSKTIFGFWVYLLTDFVLFATILASYFVLRGHPNSDLLPLPFTLVQTILLLICALTSGLGNVFAHLEKKGKTIGFFLLTFLFGFIFLWMEYIGFSRLIQEGRGWDANAFFSAYFTLLGTHGLHVVFALLWIFVLLPPVFFHGITPLSLQRITCLRMFWQFLSVVWVGIFTMIYLMGVK